METLEESLDYPTASPYAYLCCLCPFDSLNHFLCATSLTGSLLKKKNVDENLRKKKITAKNHTDKMIFSLDQDHQMFQLQEIEP